MRFVIDSHIARAVAGVLRDAGIDALHLSEWRGGELRNETDRTILFQVIGDGRAFVTADRSTVTTLLDELWAEDVHHVGVIFVDKETIAPGDIGQVSRALITLEQETRDWDWRDRISTLERPRS